MKLVADAPHWRGRVPPSWRKGEGHQGGLNPNYPSTLRSFLRRLNFYGKFNLSTTVEPLHEPLRKNTSRKWSAEQHEAFKKAKNQLQSSDVLVHYDPKKEFLGSCNTFPNGIGAALAHVMEDGSEKPELHMSHDHSSQQRGAMTISIKRH